MTINQILDWLGNTNIISLIIWLVLGYIALQVVGFVLWFLWMCIVGMLEQFQQNRKP